MKFSVFTPPASESKKVPVSYVTVTTVLAWSTTCELKVASPANAGALLSEWVDL